MSPRPGLCEQCTRARVVESKRGSRFYLCTAEGEAPGLTKYPRLPVLTCPAYTPKAAPRPV